MILHCANSLFCVRRRRTREGRVLHNVRMMRCFVRHLACVRPQMLRDDHLQRGHSLAATLPSLPLCSQSTRLPSYHCNVEQNGEYEDGDLSARHGEEDDEVDCEGHGWKFIRIGIYLSQYHHCHSINRRASKHKICYICFAYKNIIVFL